MTSDKNNGLAASGGFRSRSNKKDGKPDRPADRRRKAPNDHGKPQRRTPQKQQHLAEYQPGGDPRQLGTIDLGRAVAFDVVYRVDTQDAYANLVLPKMLRDYKVKRRDAAFATEIAYGTLRNQGVIDRIIAATATRPLSDIDPGVLNALRIGTYQLIYTRVDNYAAVDSTVNLVDAIGQGKAKGFTNGVMRKISRTSPEKWFQKLQPSGEIPAIAFKYSHPEWIAESFAQVLGIGELAAALEADSQRPTVHLVARPGEITAEELALMTEGEEGQYSPYAVYLPGGDPGRLEPVRDGLAAVQDEGSQIIGRALVEAPVTGTDNGRWLDLCAGPGGKAALIGCLARIDGATVDAVEIQPHRAELIRKTVSDLPVTVHNEDGRKLSLQPGYDRVLVDAPCSGLGALRRRPEARWRKQESDIADLTVLQYELLESAIAMTRPGGVIIYSTCSPDLRETRAIVEKAVDQLPVVELDAAELTGGMTNTGDYKSVQMWPHRHGTDAMFFAVLRKNEDSSH